MNTKNNTACETKSIVRTSWRNVGFYTGDKYTIVREAWRR